MSYSSFFASGLMAARHSPPPSPVMSIPDSPIIPSTPMRVISDVEDATPTRIPHVSQNGDRPKLRKRRSSLTVATSQYAQIKSPLRNASHAVQRQNSIMGNRSRSGSVHDNFAYGQNRSNGFATESNSLLGRLRSGSVATAIRPRRVLRKPAPPPSVPLPPLPLPLLSAATQGVLEISSPPNTPKRPPLTVRSSIDNYDQAMSSSPISALHLPDETEDSVTKLFLHDVDDMMKEN